MAEPHLDHPGEFHWFSGYRPLPVLGPCPHTECTHHAQSVIAWGPDHVRYELVECEVDDHCAGQCRAWTDGGMDATTPWLHVSADASQLTPAEAS